MRLRHVGLDSLQALTKKGLLEGILTCNLEFGECCFLERKTKVKFGLLFSIREVFLIEFTLTFGVLPRLHCLKIIDTPSLLLMIYLSIVGYTL